MITETQDMTPLETMNKYMQGQAVSTTTTYTTTVNPNVMYTHTGGGTWSIPGTTVNATLRGFTYATPYPSSLTSLDNVLAELFSDVTTEEKEQFLLAMEVTPYYRTGTTEIVGFMGKN